MVNSQSFTLRLSDLWRNLLKCRRYVVIYQPWLIFGRRNPRRRAYVENGNGAVADTGICDNIADLPGDIDDITITFCLYF
jgi:hypothetical protein